MILRVASCDLWVETLKVLLYVASCFLRVESWRW